MPRSKSLEGRKVGFDPELQKRQSMRLVTGSHGREHMARQNCSCNDDWEANRETGGSQVSPARAHPAVSLVSPASIYFQSLLIMLKSGSQACETWASGECYRSQPPHSSRPIVFQVSRLLVYPYYFKENPRHCIMILLINTSLCISKETLKNSKETLKE